jgi:hypothetical protein
MSKPASLRRCRAGLLTVAAFVSVLFCQTPSADPARARKIHVDSVLSAPGPGWEVSDALLRETPVDTWGEITVTNHSAQAAQDAKFYAEYFADDGRLCFTLAFSQDVNNEEAAGPFLPGQTRTLFSATGLAPASKPARASVYFVVPGARGSSLNGVNINAPPIILSGNEPAGSTIRVPDAPSAPVFPLALMAGNLDSSGALGDMTILATGIPDGANWARTFTRGLHFRPAELNGQPVPSPVLILLRVVRTLPTASVGAWPADEDPWVKSYVHSFLGGEIPPVNELRFCDARIFDASAKAPVQGPFTYFSVGTDWSVQALGFRGILGLVGTWREWPSSRKTTLRPAVPVSPK